MKDIKISNFADYTLKAVKNWDTHDGGGYCANLYRQNKKVAYVLQDGNGGPTDISFTVKAEEDNFHAHIATLPAVPYPESWGGGMCTINADIFIDELLNDYLELQQIKRFLKQENKLHGKIGDSWFSWKCPDTEEYRNKVKAKEPEVLFPEEVIATLQHR